MNPLDLLGMSRELGARFSVVGILPTAVLGLFVLALIWSGAPGDAPDLDRVADEAGDLSGTETTLLLVGVLAVAVLAQPFQIPLVRLLEGYWGSSGPARAVTKVGVDRQRERLGSLKTRAAAPIKDPKDAAAADAITAAAERQRLFPEADSALLPTRLGNVLRSAETRAGAPYGLEGVVAWPRLYPLLPEPVRLTVDDRRDQLDVAARFCSVFLCAALLSFALLLPHGWWLAVPAGCLLLAWLAYRASVTAALAYGEAIRSAFDLHRFDLRRALHLPLPDTRSAERAENAELSAFLVQDWDIDFRYEHPAGNEP